MFAVAAVSPVAFYTYFLGPLHIDRPLFVLRKSTSIFFTRDKVLLLFCSRFLGFPFPYYLHDARIFLKAIA